MNFGSLKSFGASITSSLSELEQQLAATVASPPRASTAPQPTSPTATVQSPISPRGSTESATRSPTANTGGTGTGTGGGGGGWSADSFRERLRKQREAQARASSSSSSTPTQRAKSSSPAVAAASSSTAQNTQRVASTESVLTPPTSAELIVAPSTKTEDPAKVAQESTASTSTPSASDEPVTRTPAAQVVDNDANNTPLSLPVITAVAPALAVDPLGATALELESEATATARDVAPDAAPASIPSVVPSSTSSSTKIEELVPAPPAIAAEDEEDDGEDGWGLDGDDAEDESEQAQEIESTAVTSSIAEAEAQADVEKTVPPPAAQPKTSTEEDDAVAVVQPTTTSKLDLEPDTTKDETLIDLDSPSSAPVPAPEPITIAAVERKEGFGHTETVQAEGESMPSAETPVTAPFLAPAPLEQTGEEQEVETESATPTSAPATEAVSLPATDSISTSNPEQETRANLSLAAALPVPDDNKLSAATQPEPVHEDSTLPATLSTAEKTELPTNEHEPSDSSSSAHADAIATAADSGAEATPSTEPTLTAQPPAAATAFEIEDDDAGADSNSNADAVADPVIDHVPENEPTPIERAALVEVQSPLAETPAEGGDSIATPAALDVPSSSTMPAEASVATNDLPPQRPPSSPPATVLQQRDEQPLPDLPASATQEQSETDALQPAAVLGSPPRSSTNTAPASSGTPKDTRLAEITTAYKRLQSLKSSLDGIALEFFPSLNGVQDTEAFERELRNLKMKAQVEAEERGRLAGQVQQQKDRLEELRDTHRLEAKSSTEEIDSLRSELAAKNAALKTLSERLNATGNDAKQQLARQTEEYERLKIVAKEEEEKRVKALSLLRALRQKLVKCEKDKDDAERERDGLRDAADQARLERTRHEQELVSMRAAGEAQLAKTRASFEREVQSLRAQAEKDARDRKSAWELEAITIRAAAAREVKERDGRVIELEKLLRDGERAKGEVFDALQVRSAEAESAKERQEAVETQMKEAMYELSEARDKISALGDELEELRRGKRDVAREDSNARRLLAEAEARHDAKVRDLEARAKQLESDRHETEEEMGRNLQERLKEVERMRAQLAQKDVDYAESVHSSQIREQRIEEGEKARSELAARLKSVEAMLAQVKEDADRATRAEAAVREELGDRSQRASELEARLEEVQTKESALRSSNKTLREELRKLQSGVLQSDRQRNPGVGYFSSFNQSSTTVATSPSGTSGQQTPSVMSPPESVSNGVGGSSSIGSQTSVARASAADEALNFEYLRNVILQFLERPEMRPHLLGVLGVILHFTPAESRRLAAKAATQK